MIIASGLVTEPLVLSPFQGTELMDESECHAEGLRIIPCKWSVRPTVA